MRIRGTNKSLCWCLAVMLLPASAMAWWGDSGEQNPGTNMAGGTSCSRSYWYCWDHNTSCAGRGYYATWNHGFVWSGRGWYHEDIWRPGYYSGSASYPLARAINQAGGDNGNNWRTFSACNQGCEWITVYEQAVGDIYNYNGIRIDANESQNSCKSCGNALTMCGQVHGYGDRYAYLNRWVVLGYYDSTALSDSHGLDEANLYFYAYTDTSHGDTISGGLWGGRHPQAYAPGDMNNAYSLNFGNIFGNPANRDAYGLAWIYAPGGAGPKFDIGSDDGERCWVNGSLITDVNSDRGLARDSDVTGGISLPSGWSRVLFKVHQGSGGGGWEGTISLRNGGDNRQNEGSVNYQSDRYGGYSVYTEQNSWAPTLTLANANGVTSPGLGAAIYTNNTTVTASGTASGNFIPLWQVMQYQWGYGLSADTNYAATTTNSANWSHTQTGVTGHRRLHFFGVSKSGRTSGQASGSNGNWTWDNSGHSNYFDVYVDNVAPVSPSFSTVSAASTSQIDLGWAIPNDQGVGVEAGSTESANATNGGSNHYRRGDVGVQVYRNGTAVSSWGTATSKNDTGLSPNTAYTYTLEARDNTSGSRGAWNNTTGPQNSTSRYTLQNAASTPTFGAATTSSIEVSTTGPVNVAVGDSGVIFKRGGSDLAKVQALTATDSGLTANTQYSYTARGVNGEGVATAESTSASAWTLSVPPNADSVTSALSDVCLDQTITFVAVGGFGAGKVQFYRYAWNQDSTYTFTGSEPAWSASDLILQPTASGQWYLHVQGCNGAGVANGTYVYSATAQPDTVVTGDPVDNNVTAGETVTLTASGAGAGIVSYKWQVLEGSTWTDLADGNGVSGVATQALEIAGVTDADAGQYRCVVTATCGAQETLAAEVTIAPKPVAWYSVRNHGPAGEFALPLDPTKTGSGADSPLIDPRRGPVRIRVTFDTAVAAADGGVDAGDVEVQDSLGNVVPASTAALVSAEAGASQTLEITLPDSVDGKRITVTLPSAKFQRPGMAKALLLGNRSCQLRCLTGDVNGSGAVNTTDMSIVRQKASDATPVTQATCIYDVNLSGSITIVDMALVKSLLEATVP